MATGIHSKTAIANCYCSKLFLVNLLTSPHKRNLMPTLSIVIAPGYTATLQPSIRGGAPVGSPISPTVVDTVYTFDLNSLANGDYDMQLSGNWEKNGQKFACRKNASGVYAADYWWELDATVTTPPTYPDPDVDLTMVTVTAILNGSSVVGALVEASLESPNNTLASAIASRVIDSVETDSSGNAVLQLIKYSQFTMGGIYRIKVTHGRTVIYDVRAKIPDADCTLDSLLNDTTG
jgi:hypothetical protein